MVCPSYNLYARSNHVADFGNNCKMADCGLELALASNLLAVDKRLADDVTKWLKLAMGSSSRLRRLQVQSF
eukprot:jgi/Botrbrau1/7258/Bobra.0021s0039.1